jgi:hypothetical protein
MLADVRIHLGNMLLQPGNVLLAVAFHALV